MRKKYLVSLLIFTAVISAGTSLSTRDSDSRENIAIRELDYDDFKDYHITYEDFFNQTPKNYLIYIYSPFCGHCENIKQLTLNFLRQVEHYYLFDYHEYTLEEHLIENPTYQIIGTPTFLLVENQELKKDLIGVSEIKNYICNESNKHT